MERRKAERTKLPEQLVLKRLDDHSGQQIEINVSDVSKSGIGFKSTSVLAIGSIYETDMVIWTNEKIHVFLEIVRIEKVGSLTYYYGASFVGLPEMDAARISVYQTINRVEKEERAALLEGVEK
ncbi:MAG: PilZ domain-containing protein [Lachnospiraceae bacterium]|nr:PilZ domain-containing protein [Lachnospiraceae bacterium]